MKIIRSINKATKVFGRLKNKGFVPTMGALHEGHISLIKRAKEENNYVIVSIFVNPIQFENKKDYRRYPRNIKKDIEKLKEIKVHYLFLPSIEEMYRNHLTYVEVERLSDLLEGRFRPGHFRGVTTVIVKLLNIVRPDRLYMGKKDYQQMLLVKKLLKDLNFNVKLIECETVRDKSGLALSSRNIFLNDIDKAAMLYRVLKNGRYMIKYNGMRQEDAEKLMEKELNKFFSVDYVKVVNTKEFYSGNKRVILAAVRADGVRLIDSLEI